MFGSTIKAINILLIGVVIFGCQSGTSVLTMTSTPNIPAPTKKMTSNSLHLEERWRWSGKIWNASSSRPAIATTENHIAIIEYIGSRQRIHIFNAHTGNSLWNSEYISNIRAIAVDEKRVYIGTITDVQAFDLETGDWLWQGAVQPSLKRGGFVIYSRKSQLDVYDILDPIFYVLDAKTGQTIQKIVNPSLFVRGENEIDYLSERWS